MGFVHVSFSSKLYIPFMCCVYKIFNLGNIFRLKILEEIKSKKKKTNLRFCLLEMNECSGIGPFYKHS